MFVRFRETGQRLQVSLAETRRHAGRVRNDHVAGLGSVPLASTQADRLAFWTKLHQRLATLANRVDSATHGAILAAVHARIPMPTPADQQAVQLDNARADAAFWASLGDLHSDGIAGNKALLATVTRTIADHEAEAAKVSDKARAAAERLAKAERGEDAGGIPEPMTRKAFLAAIGWTAADQRHAERLIEIEALGGHDLLMSEIAKRSRRADKAAARAITNAMRGRR